MKFKAKVIEIFVRIALVLMVLLSLGLSIYIWTSDQRFAHIEPQTEKQTTVKNHDIKALRDIYMPTQVFDFRHKQLYQIYDANKNLPLEFSKSLQNAALQKATRLKRSASAYRGFLNNANYMQLVYPARLSIALLFADVVPNKDVTFNRIYVPRHAKNVFYLGNDAKNVLYRIKAKKLSFKRLLKAAKNAKTYLPVKLARLRNGYVPFYAKSQKVAIYSYLVNNQTDSYFVSRLLGTSGISKRSEREATVYSAGVYDRLSVPKNGSSYEYINYSDNKVPKSKTARLDNSVSYVHQIGLLEQDLRFFDTDGTSVTYRNFVEGFPVFMNAEENAQVRVTYNTTGLILDFNSTDLQIPVPFDGRTASLPATNTVIKQLEEKGIDQSDIQLLTIGYQVQYDQTHERLVNLMPTYYIKVFGQWKSLKQWQTTDITTLKMIANN